MERLEERLDLMADSLTLLEEKVSWVSGRLSDTDEVMDMYKYKVRVLSNQVEMLYNDLRKLKEQIERNSNGREEVRAFAGLEAPSGRESHTRPQG